VSLFLDAAEATEGPTTAQKDFAVWFDAMSRGKMC
jgi:hypothetical protein